jgi:hypothetical protein
MSKMPPIPPASRNEMERLPRKSRLVRFAYWLARTCPDGHGCPPKLSDILSGAGGGC